MTYWCVFLNSVYLSFSEVWVCVCVFYHCYWPTTERMDGLMMLSIFLTLCPPTLTWTQASCKSLVCGHTPLSSISTPLQHPPSIPPTIPPNLVPLPCHYSNLNFIYSSSQCFSALVTAIVTEWVTTSSTKKSLWSAPTGFILVKEQEASTELPVDRAGWGMIIHCEGPVWTRCRFW